MTGSARDAGHSSEWSSYSNTALGEAQTSQFDVAQVFASYNGSQQIGTAEGHYRAMSLTADLQYFDCNLVYKTAFDLQQTLNPGLCIAVILKGHWHIRSAGKDFVLKGAAAPFGVGVGEVLPVTNCLPEGSQVRMAGLLVSGDAIGRFAEDDDPGLRAVASLKKPGISVHDLSSCRSIAHLLRKMYDNPHRGEMAKINLQSLGLSVLVELGAHLLGCRDHSCTYHRNARDLAFDAKKLIDENLLNLPTVPKLAEMLDTNDRTLRRAFKANVGCTILDYCRESRLQIAQRLLRQKYFQIAQVAYKVGYSNPANFSIAYKARFGYPPGKE